MVKDCNDLPEGYTDMLISRSAASFIRGLTFVIATSVSVAAQEAMTLEQVETAYKAEDFVTARAGLVALAEAGDMTAQYRLGFMIANSMGGEFDRAEAIRWLEAAIAQGYGSANLLLARSYLTGNPEVPDYERAAELLALEVETGSAEAHYYLGQLYRIGRGVQGDPPRGFELLRKAAGANVADAQFALAEMYSRGEGTAPDAAQASRWLLQAAEGGSAEAQMSLYFNYARGTGFPKNEALALQWLTEAANRDHTLAQRILGSSLLLGEGIEANTDLGLQYLRRAAQKGEAGAQSNLGYAYMTGVGVEKDVAQALEWYQLAAEQGLTRAALVTGELYQSEELGEPDIEQAIKYYKIALMGKDDTAASRLGALLASGVIPPEEEPEQGVVWVAMAAEQGDAVALDWLIARADSNEQYASMRLGLIYADGIGTDAVPAKAAPYLDRAARAGLVEAQERLADLFASGSGVEQDYVEAHMWANVAAANGSDSAAERRDLLANLMTADQVAEAQARAKAVLASE